MNQSKRYILMLAIIGTVTIGCSLGWNLAQSKKALVESARINARMSFKMNILYRMWNAQQGGVYVRISENTPPNPHLSFIPDRDVTTLEGIHLTLVNPAYMTRKVFELGEEKFGLRSHITSLNPIRSENEADPWETEALNAFENGTKEVSSIEDLGGKDYLRLMKPLITEKECLKCHEKQGYKVGDIRGGISVSIPMKPLWAIYYQARGKIIGIHVFLWIIGVGCLFLGLIWFEKSEKKRSKAQNRLHQSNVVLKRSQTIARLGSYVLDISTGLWTSSDILDEIFGIDSDYRRDIEGWGEIIHPKDRQIVLDYFNQHVLSEHQLFDRKYRIFRIVDQQERWVHGLGKLNVDEKGNLVSMVGTIRDITDGQQIEMKLKAKIAQMDRLNTYMVGRELTMITMKNEVNDLCEKAGLPRRYNVSDE